MGNWQQRSWIQIQAPLGSLHHAIILESPGTTPQFCTFPLSVLQRHLTLFILYFVINDQTIQESDHALIPKSLLDPTLMKHW